MLEGLIARLSARPGFQAWAFSTPWLRRVARRRALALFDLTAGFVHTQVLTACVRLDLFTRLARRPATAAEVGKAVGMAVEPAERLLDAAVALDLLRRGRDGRYRIGPLAGPLLDRDGGVAAMIEHNAALYADLADPLALLRGWPERPTALARFWPYAKAAQGDEAGAAADYSRLMRASQDLVAADALDAWGDLGVGPWLDLGGGDGGFLIEVARRAPSLTGVLADLPPVADQARARFEALGLAGRLRAEGVDLRQPPADPGRFATASLIRVLHDHDDADALALLRHARAALAPGGRLLIAEPMRAPPGDARRIADAYFGPYLLAMGRGRPRTAAELARLARQAGFTAAERLPTRRPFLAQAIRLSSVSK